MTSTAQRPEDENLGIGSNLLYGLQHVLTMYGGIVAVPLIVGQAAGLSPADIGLLIAASLFVGGAATLLQTIGLPFFGCQLPLVQGVSFASVATIVAIVGANGGEGGLPVVFVAGTERSLRYRDIAALREGDRFVGGKLYDAQGNEVPLQDEDDHSPRVRTASSAGKEREEVAS